MLSIIIPTFNEELNIITIVERISNSLQEVENEIVFVNDASTDLTLSKIEEAKSLFPSIKITVVSHSINKGIPDSWATGIAEARFNLIAFMDCDLQNPPEALPEMLKVFLENPCDVTQGIRSEIDRTRNVRFYMSRILNWMINRVFKLNHGDSKSGFLLGKREVLEDVLRYREGFKYFQTFIGVALARKNYKVVEVETLFPERRMGNSFISKLQLTKVVILVILDFFQALRKLPKNNSFVLGINIENRKLHARNFFFRIIFYLYFHSMPAHAWLISSKTKYFYKFLKEMEFASREKLEEFQFKRLQELIHHSYVHVPFYRGRMISNNLHPSKLLTLKDFEKFPITTKDDVRRNVHFSMFSDNHNKREMHRIRTSGSTGEPFVCYADKFQLEMRFAHTIRALEMTGWSFGNRQIRLWHQTLGMSLSQVIREKLDALLMRRRFIPAFEISETSIKAMAKKIKRFRPFLLDGYAESLNFISIAIQNYGLSISPKVVMSSAQQLTSETRNSIETALGCKVFDKYGSREFSGIAYQCSDSEYHHVQSESYLVEILHNGKQALPGQIGEVVITDLNNLSMPLIRYAIGDLAEAVVQGDCPCGRKHMTIGNIIGRTQALISCPNGVWLPGTFFAHFFKDFDFSIRHYQVFQSSTGDVTIYIVPTNGWEPRIGDDIIKKLQIYMGTEAKVEIQVVEAIPLLQTGKRTPVVSELKYKFREIDSGQILTNLKKL